MTVDQAKKKLAKKRALLNNTRKEIDQLKKFILANGGVIDKADNTERNHRIFLDVQGGISAVRLASKYKVTVATIKRIYERELHKH